MKYNRRLAYAISVALGSAAHGAVAADEDQPTLGITEVVVTAQRRSESVQDVPITVQAITGDQLKQLNVVSFNDLLKYTPNVTFSGNGPGTGNIFIRGLGGVGSGNQSQSTTAPFPNVGLYLDDQSMQFPARNNDVYLVDMERVEVLEGPQGTLFGGGAQAGAVRYITNKPKLGVTEGIANAGYGITAGGDPNYNGNFVFNLPFGDNIALRAVIFSDHQGGYISNVPDHISVPPVLALTDGPFLRPGSPPASNAGIAGSNLNTVQYGGARLSGLVKFNDDWELLLQQNYQHFEADGYFYEYPTEPNGNALGNHQITAWAPAFDKDKYESTAWTLTGHVADLKTVYTGSYMVRNIDAQQDYSNYLRSAHGSYYACSGQGAGYHYYFASNKPTTCYAPVGSWRDQVKNTHQSHEFRVSTNEDYRIRALAGVYWEKFVIDDNMNFNYMGIPQCSAANLAISAAGGADCVTTVGAVFPGFWAGSPGYRTDTNTAFGEDVQRGYKQTAVFGSIDFDIIPKVLTITGGTRHFKYDEFEHGSEYFSASSTVLNVPNGTCTHCGWGINLNKSESGTKSRGNLTWHVTPDILAYYTWSQGFRPGGFNRTHTFADNSVKLAGEAPFTAGGKDFQFNKPVGYHSDSLVNNEIGVKTEFFDHRIQLNGSIYQMDWKDVQLPLYDPVHLGNTTFDVNGPAYRIRGLELQFVARVTQGLTIQGSSSWNSSEQTDAPCLTSNRVDTSGKAKNANPTPLGQCITQVKSAPYTNPYGKLGTRLPFSPPWQFNVRGRYDWEMVGYNAFASIGASHVSSMSNEPASFPSGENVAIPTTTLLRYQIPGYTTYDGAIGVVKDSWSVTFQAANLFNSDAVTNISSGEFIKSQIPIRPRVLSLNMGYKF